MNIAAIVFSCLFILLVLVDGFEGMILPRRVGRKFRFSLMLYRGLWPVWCGLARTIKKPKRRQTFLSIFGPFSLLLLFALWGVLLVLGFGVLNWSLGTQLQTPAGTVTDIFTYLYLSGVTFFTLGYGDIVPLNHPVDRPLTAIVDDVRCFDGVTGRRGKRLATLIVDVNRESGWR